MIYELAALSKMLDDNLAVEIIESSTNIKEQALEIEKGGPDANKYAKLWMDEEERLLRASEVEGELLVIAGSGRFGRAKVVMVNGTYDPSKRYPDYYVGPALELRSDSTSRNGIESYHLRQFRVGRSIDGAIWGVQLFGVNPQKLVVAAFDRLHELQDKLEEVEPKIVIKDIAGPRRIISRLSAIQDRLGF